MLENKEAYILATKEFGTNKTVFFDLFLLYVFFLLFFHSSDYLAKHGVVMKSIMWPIGSEKHYYKKTCK
jgi:hypothetical protein